METRAKNTNPPAHVPYFFKLTPRCSGPASQYETIPFDVSHNNMPPRTAAHPAPTAAKAFFPEPRYSVVNLSTVAVMALGARGVLMASAPGCPSKMFNHCITILRPKKSKPQYVCLGTRHKTRLKNSKTAVLTGIIRRNSSTLKPATKAVRWNFFK